MTRGKELAAGLVTVLWVVTVGAMVEYRYRTPIKPTAPVPAKWTVPEATIHDGPGAKAEFVEHRRLAYTQLHPASQARAEYAIAVAELPDASTVVMVSSSDNARYARCVIPGGRGTTRNVAAAVTACVERLNQR